MNLTLISENLSKIINNYQDQKDIDLYIPYYHDKNATRREELMLCLKLNTQNSLFKHIFIMNESDPKPDFIEKSDRIQIINCGRLKFQGIFKYASELSGKETTKILINTDIVIGENFDQLTLTEKQFICLSRHDIMSDGQYRINVGGGSHDCWIWKDTLKSDIGQFFMGKFLCDGVLTNELYGNHYQLKNPVYDLKIYHVHQSGVRNYSYTDKVIGQRVGIIFSKNDGIFNSKDLYNDGFNWS